MTILCTIPLEWRRMSSTSFVTTRWSMVEAATGDDPVERQRGLDEFTRLYRSPCEAWLRARGDGADRAEETVQDFLYRVIFERGLLATAERGRSLRALVIRALQNHRTDLFRRETTQRRHEEAAAAGRDAIEESAAERAFDLEWARTQLAEAVERTRRKSLGSKHDAAWRCFERRVLLPAIQGTRRPGYEAVAREFGIPGADRATVLVREMRMKVLAALQQVVSETARSPEDVEAELAHVKACLRERGL